MGKPRNPFRMRVSEPSEADETFIRLFSADVLDILEVTTETLWDRPRIFRSAPGGGKTSLLRLFTPNSLLTVRALKDRSDESKNLFRRLKKLEVLDENGPKLLGIHLSCARGLATLDDLDIDIAKKKRLLLSLLNARIVIAALRGAMTIRGSRHIERAELEQLEIHTPVDTTSLGISFPCSGADLYDWACEVEKRVRNALDSFITPTESLPGHDSLIALEIVNPANLLYNNHKIVERVLLMLDDLHNLTEVQRRFLLKELIETRASIGIWIAERLIALNIDELLSDGAILGRDHEGVTNLEDFWRKRGDRRFEKVVKTIADCRVKEAADIEIGSFDICLQNSLDNQVWQEKLIQGKQEIASRIHSLNKQNRYSEWILQREQQEGTPKETAIGWRTLEILIEREEQRSHRQLSLLDDLLQADQLEKSDKASVREAAELFICKEFKVPYYYGSSRLASIASFNIEQFLWLASGIFEESASAALINRAMDIPPNRQENILKKSIKQRWDSLPQDVLYGYDVRNFLEAIGNFAKWQTDRSTAPYAPGVTGIAISMADRDKLQDIKQVAKDPQLEMLARVIRVCVAHNLFEVTLDAKQGQKGGERWMLLYLNRMLCLHFNLPLGYGGWRKKSLKELVDWLRNGFKPSTEEELQLW